MPLKRFEAFSKEILGGKQQSRPDKPTHAILVQHHDLDKNKTDLRVVALNHDRKEYVYQDGGFGTKALFATVHHGGAHFETRLDRAVKKLTKQIPGRNNSVIRITVPGGKDGTSTLHDRIQQDYPYANAAARR